MEGDASWTVANEMPQLLNSNLVASAVGAGTVLWRIWSANGTLLEHGEKPVRKREQGDEVEGHEDARTQVRRQSRWRERTRT